VGRNDIDQLDAHGFHIETCVIPTQVEQDVQTVRVQEPLCELDW
jgi:hypothetical protein